MKLIKTYDYMSKLARIIALISCVMLGFVMVFTIVSIIVREVFKIPIVGANELVEVALAVLVFTGLCYGQTTKAHINLFVLLLAFPKKLSAFIYGLDLLIASVVAGYAGYALFLQAFYVLQKNLVSSLRRIPYYPMYFIAAVCMIVFAVILLLDALMAFYGVFNKEMNEHVRESWV